MYALLTYSLKAGVCLAVFYLFFKLLLSRETLHRFNRIVVLAGMVLAFALPLCVVTVYRELPQLSEITAAEESEPPVVLPEEETAFDWKPLLGALFGAGAVGMLLWTLRSLLGVLRIIRSGRRERLDDGSILVRVAGPVTPFSWGRHIVISEEDMALSGREIVLHEQAHLHLHHSVDLLVTDLAGCLQWFNPAMWLLRRELRAIHEYEADRAVIESGVEARDYQLLLIRKAVGGRWYSVANSFNHSKLKNRITMMLRKKSSRWTGAKALFVLPLTAAALGAFAETVYVVPDDKVTKESVTVNVSGPNISLNDLDDKPLVLVDGKEMPLQAIPAERIASIDVFKDSRAAELYGEKGRNGVIIVTLKKEGDRKPKDSVKMDEIVVVGYGALEKESGKKTVMKATDDDKTKTIETRISAKGKPVYIINGMKVDNIEELSPEQIDEITVLKNSLPEEYKKQGYDGMVVITTKNVNAKLDKIHKINAYFNSDEWKAQQKRLESVDKYFNSDEWKAAQKRIAEAEKRMAEAEKELNGKLVSIHADRDKKQQDKSGATHATDRITMAGIPDDCLIFINGKRATKARMAKISSWKKVRSMTIYKGQQAIDKFGPEAAAGAIEINTRKR